MVYYYAILLFCLLVFIVRVLLHCIYIFYLNKACESLTDIDNGVMLLTAGVEGNWSYNSSVTFTCDIGYYVTIDQPMICSSDGSWNGTKPACVRVTCSPLLCQTMGRMCLYTQLTTLQKQFNSAVCLGLTVWVRNWRIVILLVNGRTFLPYVKSRTAVDVLTQSMERCGMRTERHSVKLLITIVVRGLY